MVNRTVAQVQIRSTVLLLLPSKHRCNMMRWSKPYESQCGGNEAISTPELLLLLPRVGSHGTKHTRISLPASHLQPTGAPLLVLLPPTNGLTKRQQMPGTFRALFNFKPPTTESCSAAVDRLCNTAALLCAVTVTQTRRAFVRTVAPIAQSVHDQPDAMRRQVREISSREDRPHSRTRTHGSRHVVSRLDVHKTALELPLIVAMHNEAQRAHLPMNTRNYLLSRKKNHISKRPSSLGDYNKCFKPFFSRTVLTRVNAYFPI
ncbi:DNA-binding protein [Anopheles sinensis]|uniref:DNA-binding protein n=1 Tax=Anopheles sinensis TaxID=74873 RepID=A0A084VGN4_ANOSI|nr:DNA-binding protein [Anopheles sinensis]